MASNGNANKAITASKGMSMKNAFKKYTMFFALAVIWILFTTLTNGVFFTPRNLTNLFIQTMPVSIATCGMVFVMVAGHIDLSVGSVLGFLGALMAIVLLKTNNLFVATIVTLVIGMAIGAVHGYLVSHVKVPAFIATLASMMIFQGCTIGVTKGASITPKNQAFKNISSGYVPDFINGSSVNITTVIIGVITLVIVLTLIFRARSKAVSNGFEVSDKRRFFATIIATSLVIILLFTVLALYSGIPYCVLILAVCAVVLTIIATRTRFGRYTYAIGGNKDASRVSGVNIKKTTISIFVLMGFMTALSSIVYTSRLNTAIASAGQGFEMDVIAAAIIGGTSLSGGEGTILGAIVGSIVMSSLNNGMSLMNMGSFQQYVVKGVILLIFVAVDVRSRLSKGDA